MATESIIKCRLCTSVQHGDRVWSHRVQLPPTPRLWPARLRVHQLSESASLFPSALFSAEFHFCDFSDSSEEERFCLLHLARLFLNQTYTWIFKKKKSLIIIFSSSISQFAAVSLLLLFKVECANVRRRNNKSVWNSSHTPFHLKKLNFPLHFSAVLLDSFLFWRQ